MLVRSLRCVCWLRQETGYIDVAAADYVLDTTGSVTLLNTVAQGALSPSAWEEDRDEGPAVPWKSAKWFDREL